LRYRYDVDVVSERLDDFELARELGRGGSGIVYEACRVNHSEKVALKVQRELDPREKERFLREAQLMRRVSHPALVTLLASGVFSDGRAYLVMDLLHGETLADRLRRGPLPVQEAVRLFAPLASAVQTLHDEGLVHRDIKPENIMLANAEDGSLRPVLLDFGIVREVEGMASTTTQAGFVRGSRAYMAPERFFGQGASVASDVYELGVTLYMMLAGRLPWGEEDAAGSRLDPQALPRPSGKALSRVVMRAISTRPEQRYADAGAFRDAVIQAADTKSTPEITRTTDAEPIIPRPEDSETESSASITIEGPMVPMSTRTTQPVSLHARPSRLPWLAVAAAAVLGVGGATAYSRYDASHPQEAMSASPLASSPVPPAPSNTAATTASNASTAAPPSSVPGSASAQAPTPPPSVRGANGRNQGRPAASGSAGKSASSAAGASPPPSTAPKAAPSPSGTSDVYYIDRR